MQAIYTSIALGFIALMCILLISCIPVVDRLLRRTVCKCKGHIYERDNTIGSHKKTRLYFCDRCGTTDPRIAILPHQSTYEKKNRVAGADVIPLDFHQMK